jgi:hypothetical protein
MLLQVERETGGERPRSVVHGLRSVDRRITTRKSYIIWSQNGPNGRVSS